MAESSYLRSLSFFRAFIIIELSPLMPQSSYHLRALIIIPTAIMILTASQQQHVNYAKEGRVRERKGAGESERKQVSVRYGGKKRKRSRSKGG